MAQQQKPRQPRTAERPPQSRVREVPTTPPVAKAPKEPPRPAPAPAQPEPSVAALPNVEPAALPVDASADYGPTIGELLQRVDRGWLQFLDAAGAFPSERMDEHLEGGWTRKQMLAHISAWHDLTHDRLVKMGSTGQPVESVADADAFNARVARQAIGRTAGEVLKEMEMTFNRLRRQLARLTDEQLAAHDGWAELIVAGNTYEHYEEHAADVYQPPPADGRAGRR